MKLERIIFYLPAELPIGCSIFLCVDESPDMDQEWDYTLLEFSRLDKTKLIRDGLEIYTSNRKFKWNFIEGRWEQK